MRYTTHDSYTAWSQIRDHLEALSGDWIFRGQKQACWGLTTTLDRATTRMRQNIAERVVCRAFQRNAHNYLQAHEIPISQLEWFALMQHHGAPTRLLDCTRSPYVASFFAVENATKKGGTCAVWAIDNWWLKEQGRDVIWQHLPTLPKYSVFATWHDIWEDKDFEEVFHDEQLPVVMAAEPYRKNQRLTIQRGLFLCPGDVDKGFEGNFCEFNQDELETHLLKFVIPNDLRVEILTDLNYMNVNRATLFPGIDGFAQSLQQEILDAEDHGQTSRSFAKRDKYGVS